MPSRPPGPAPRVSPVTGTYVFVGPTLPVTDAQSEFSARYLPPVTAGAVAGLWPLRPRAIGIIDGPSAHSLTVWHKEIMWLMEQGVHVFGAAGLGALRAAELHAFGMRGVGWVYQAFHDGSLEQDDEVAVACHDAAGGYRPKSEAMVNIRRTLLAAQREEIITAETCRVLTESAKARFYTDRNWPALLAAARQAVPVDELAALRTWLPGGRIDQMADDAMAMLREMHTFLATDPAPMQVPWTTANTEIWHAARTAASTPGLANPASFRVTEEAVLDELRLLGPVRYEDIRCRGLLRLFAGQAAERDGMVATEERLSEAAHQFRAARDLVNDADFSAFLTQNDISPHEFRQLLASDDRGRWACDRVAGEESGTLRDELRIRGQYEEFANRARDKCDYLSRAGLDGAAPGDSRYPVPDAVRWYFADRVGIARPDDMTGYAQSSGFPDERSFQRAVWREFCYVTRPEENEHPPKR